MRSSWKWLAPLVIVAAVLCPVNTADGLVLKRHHELPGHNELPVRNEPLLERTYTFQPTTIMGFVSLPGTYIDIISCVHNQDGTAELMLVAEKVLVVEWAWGRDLSPGIRCDFGTLRATPEQIAKLDQAQAQGTLLWMLRKPSAE